MADFYTIQVKIEGCEDWLWAYFDHRYEIMIADHNFYGLVLSSAEIAERTIKAYFSDEIIGVSYIEYNRESRMITETKIVAVTLSISDYSEVNHD